MTPRVPIRLLTFGLLLFAVLDTLLARLNWTNVAVGLTALVIGLPMAYLLGQIRETMASYGVSTWEIGFHRPPRIPGGPSATPHLSTALRPAVPRRLPAVVAVVSRVAVLVLITTAAMAFRTVVAFEMLQ